MTFLTDGAGPLMPAQDGDLDRAASALESLKTALRVRRRATIVIAAALYALKDMYPLLGYGSFADLCADPEVGLTPATARRYIRIYEVLVVEGGIPESELDDLSSDRLQVLRSVPPEARRKIMPVIRELAWRDLRNEAKAAVSAGSGDGQGAAGPDRPSPHRCRWWHEGRCTRYA